MRFLDLFSGIGGFRFGMEAAGHKCIGFCDNDKFAKASYKAIFNTKEEKEYGDIRKVTKEEWRQLRGKCDLICAGFPCQSFSFAGKRQGFLDHTRGTLFFEVARVAQQIQPRLLLLENVKGLLSHDDGRTFRTILATLDELGYDVEWQILNSADFGVPQYRERVFIVGHLRGAGGREIFPLTPPSGTASSPRRLVRAVMRVDHQTVRQNGKRIKARNAPMFTLTTCDRHGVLVKDEEKGLRIRKLTARECWRLQGMPDWAFTKVAMVCSETQLYKQAGNGVTVNVIYEIAKKLTAANW